MTRQGGADEREDGRFSRYSRQILLRQVGIEGQQKLASARVGLVGCGALGSAIANHLVRAGVGYLRIFDRDYPELHNLQRQALFDERDVASRIPKAEAAAAHLRAINSTVVVEPQVVEVDERSLPVLATGLDLLVDGTDNYEARFAINDYAVQAGIPWIYGGVAGTSGMTMTIVPRHGPCLRCLSPDQPASGRLPAAETAGVLGPIAAAVASVEATEVIKLIIAPETRNRSLLLMDWWTLTFEKVATKRDPTCPSCGAVRRQ